MDLGTALKGFQIDLALPDLWQQDALRALESGSDLIVAAPTGAGKTYIFERFAGEGHPSGGQAVYTVPTRALANEKWREWRARGWKVGLATGDLAEAVDAPVLVATLETQRERLVRGEGPALLVIDEYQMIAHPRRGLNYELAVALSPPDTQLLMLSGSVANPGDVASWLRRLGRRVEVVEHHERPVPLEDLPIGALPEVAPREIRNFWQRLAASTLLSSAAPLLIFAPQRRAAEHIARKIASALPIDESLPLDEETRRLAGKDLAPLIQKRVAWHHSGLSLTQRAAIVEPLAKAGQLRVIVATMGLAAGINFSVRSVYVADRHYRDGPFEKVVSADELLQMYGRAGRRGLDEIGYGLSSDRGPRLSDGRALRLLRSQELDWPNLLRIMDRASREGRSPVEAARAVRDRLFSEQELPLGFARTQAGTAEADATSSPVPTDSGAALFGLGPTQRELRNSRGDWETWEASRLGRHKLGECRILRRGKCVPALMSGAVAEEFVAGLGRLARLIDGDREPAPFGMEVVVARAESEVSHHFRLSKRMRKLTRRTGDQAQLTWEDLEELMRAELPPHLTHGRFAGFVRRGPLAVARVDFSEEEVDAYRDEAGTWLYRPEIRSRSLQAETHFTDSDSGECWETVPHSPAWSWRKLGLIDEAGHPTHRGTLFSFFQHGEGLAVAAALEDESYAVEDIVWHLANLRGGHRFESLQPVEAGGSDRLGTVCRATYGPADYPGYLQLGLPIGYGEGTAEAVQSWFEGDVRRSRRHGDSSDAPGRGDIERAAVEWLSLLRHLRHAPDHDLPRWRALKAEAERLLQHRARGTSSLPESAFPPALLSRRPEHRLSRSALRRGAS